jgi:hypothetical protein
MLYNRGSMELALVTYREAQDQEFLGRLLEQAKY